MVAKLLQRRLLCTKAANHQHQQQQPWSRWSVKQVSKSNFSESLEELKNHIHNSDFIAVSSQKTGAFSSPWRRVLPFLDTPETAYLKSKDAAERFQVLQFVVCPFTLKPSTPTSNTKIIAHPYNFHLFPRDELNMGMPSYSFSCQTSYLTSMAREGFDFNVCIYDGISYLSRVQESIAKDRLENPSSAIYSVKSSSTPSVADAVFTERIKSRVQYWRDACKNKNKGSEEALIRSLRRLILGGEVYGSRPCMSIDVCNERQVQLVLKMLSEFFDDLIPLIIPDNGKGPKAVRVVLTSSAEDKNLLERELQDLEGEQNRKVRGFREVIDAISASQKPVIAYDCLNEFTFIHSKFLGPLPQSLNEFMCSLRLVFPHVLDVNNLLKEIGPLRKANNLPAALSYLKRQFFVPVDMEIPHQVQENEGKNYGHNVLRTAYLFAKLSSILKITHDTPHSVIDDLPSSKSYANIFNTCFTNLQEPIDGENILLDNVRKVNTEDLVFFWGFRGGMSAGELRNLLRGTHGVFSEEFEIQMVDKSCAVLAFWKPNLAEKLLEVMDSSGVGSDKVRELISEGLRAASYEIYKKVCQLGLWETDLADSFDKALAECPDDISAADSRKESSEIYWNSDLIKLDDL
ncbi:Ribonuclease CAF1 [Macleaya cordata]|uniref:Ribonuclease CAF1 n=1 Tax=Macleaya cordata TaxID=56857 RepID=A0A200QLR5_MACCD|nr:Ribonuclease CAF1 [Macleaya cordata]